MNIVLKPFRWFSAHRDAKFTFDYENQYALTSVVDTDDKALFIFATDGLAAQEVGDLIYIDSGIYKGYHKITSIPFNNWYVTETDYIGDQTSGTLYFIDSHEFKIYAGYSTGSLATLFPYTLIATFAPEPNEDGQLVVNISGYVNKIFDVINSNDYSVIGGNDVYYNLFRQIQLVIDDALVSEHIVLNSAIDMFTLNSDYVGTNRSLNAGNLGEHYLSCGNTINFTIYNDYVIGEVAYEEAVAVPSPADFDANDFDASDFDTVGG